MTTPNLGRPDLIRGKYYTLVDYPEYGKVMFTYDGTMNIDPPRQAPLRFVVGCISIWCAVDTKVLEVSADK